MRDTISSRFTVGVFQNVEWAERGVQALRQRGFAPESLTIIAKDAPDVADLVRRSLGSDGHRVDVNGLGASVATGPMVDVLQGQDGGLARKGLAAVMRRVGFQAHDGRIFETLTARGGVLLAVESEPRAADALATLHAYGGGNAAIGAWSGRVWRDDRNQMGVCGVTKRRQRPTPRTPKRGNRPMKRAVRVGTRFALAC